jgi:hypothetical protein
VLEGCSINGNGQLVVPAPGFQKTHAAGFSLSYLRPGNPGPQNNFDVTADAFRQVVPHFVIIQ